MNSESATDKIMEASIKQHNSAPAESSSGLKKCPFFAEMIQAEAIKCRYCSEFLDGAGRFGPKSGGTKLYFSTPIVIISLLFIGPLALPLVWMNPVLKS